MVIEDIHIYKCNFDSSERDIIRGCKDVLIILRAFMKEKKCEIARIDYGGRVYDFYLTDVEKIICSLDNIRDITCVISSGDKSK